MRKVGLFVVGAVLSDSVMGAEIYQAEIDNELLVLNGVELDEPGTTPGFVELAGVELDCSFSDNQIVCDMPEDTSLEEGTTYQVRYTLPNDGGRARSIPFEVAVPNANVAGGGSHPYRLVVGSSQWYQAGDIAEFHFHCDNGKPVGLSAVQNENSSWDVWRIVDIDVGDCGQLSNGCGIVRALKLSSGSEPIYLRGTMTCR